MIKLAASAVPVLSATTANHFLYDIGFSVVLPGSNALYCPCVIDETSTNSDQAQHSSRFDVVTTQNSMLRDVIYAHAGGMLRQC